MVELVEVKDEAFDGRQAGPIDDDDEYSDTDSEISSDNDSLPDDETLADRLYALKDIVPATTRSRIASALGTSRDWVFSGLGFSGKAIYVLSTSALLLGVPWALAFAEEQQMVEMEKEMRMRESGNELLGGSSGDAVEARAAL